MARRPHAPTPGRSRRLSRDADASTLGAHHVSRSGAGGSRNVRTPQSTRAARHARYVEAVSPRTTTAESAVDYSRRVRTGDYVEQTRRQHVRHRRIVIVVIVAIVAAIAIGVGVFTYFSTMDARLSFDDASLDAELVAVDEGPQFVLCAASLGTAVDEGDCRGDAYLLVRADVEQHTLAFIDIPSAIVVTTRDNQRLALHDVRAQQGNGALIRAIAELADVDISEFVATDAAGIRSMAESAGGVGFDVTEMVDDPRAGTIVLDAGEAQLDGDEALLVLRALNFQKPYEQRSLNRTSFTMQLLNTLMTRHGSAQTISDLAPSITSSASTSELLAFADGLGTLTDLTIYSAVVPGTSTDDGNGYAVSTARWQAMMDAVRDGRAPSDAGPVDTALDPASTTVEVRNGGGITGAAASVGDILTGQGYKVTYVGNMEDNAVYDETFVVYRDAAFEGAARVVQQQIGVGRVINGGDFYTFGTKLLVVVGKDYVVPA